jgi:hypothetical protein
MINGWHSIAFNQAPDSANEIHGDRIAKQFGFRGGLVPGVTISAYLLHPAVEAWGMDFLNRGAAHVRVGSPLYDEEPFEVEILDQSDESYQAEIRGPDARVSATADVSLPVAAPPPPSRRGDPLGDKAFEPPAASVATFEELQRKGCHAFRYRWTSEHNMRSYVRDESATPMLHRPDEGGYANMGFLLGTSNWVLAANAYMNPWVHLETRSQNYRAVPLGTAIITEVAIADFYEKKGHEFVDADVALYDEADDACLATISLRAIYRLRGL